MNELIGTVEIVFYLLTAVIISGLSTSDIQRLLKGSDGKITDKDCRCDSCGGIIPIYKQIPVVAYIASYGRCSMCGAKIPVVTAVQEGAFIIFAVITGILTDFSFWAVAINFLVYELYKTIMICIKGRRKKEFGKSLLVSVTLNICLFGLVFVFMAGAEYFKNSL